MSEAKKRCEKLTPRHEKALVALLSQPTIAEASKDSGVSVATLFRWLNNPDFLRRYREAKRERYVHAVSRLQAESGIAVNTLVAIAKDPSKGGTARVAAAKAILEYAAKGTGFEDLEARLDELEAKLAKQKLGVVA